MIKTLTTFALVAMTSPAMGIGQLPDDPLTEDTSLDTCWKASRGKGTSGAIKWSKTTDSFDECELNWGFTGLYVSTMTADPPTLTEADKSCWRVTIDWDEDLNAAVVSDYSAASQYTSQTDCLSESFGAVWGFDFFA